MVPGRLFAGWRQSSAGETGVARSVLRFSSFFFSAHLLTYLNTICMHPQWDSANTEIDLTFAENPELSKFSPLSMKKSKDSFVRFTCG